MVGYQRQMSGSARVPAFTGRPHSGLIRICFSQLNQILI